MRALVLVILACAAAAACAGTSARDAPADAAPPDTTPSGSAAAAASPVEEGRRLAENLCASCHAVELERASLNPEAPPLWTLAERYPGALLEDAFPRRMDVGHPAMPAFDFTDAQVDALLAYLLSIQERRGV